MTNWEKSCVDSLVTSPIAFALFKAKQKNKRHVDQYINTIWPYEIKKISNDSKADKDGKNAKEILKPIINFLKDLLKQGESGYVDREYKLDRAYTAEELYVAIKNIPKIVANKTKGSIGSLIFCSHDESSVIVHMEPNKDVNFLRNMFNAFLMRDKTSRFYTITTDTFSNRQDTTGYISKLIRQLSGISEKKATNKFKRVYLGQNVGIEIEYEGIWQKYLEKKLNSSRYAISFNSGIDGGSHDGSKYCEASRLRENRLRINGHRGLAALHYLVEDMIKSKCSIANTSGMHYHIDLTHFTAKQLDMQIDSKFKKLAIDNQIERQLADIFEIKGNRIVLDTMFSLLRYPTEFMTIEWRMGTPTFNFTKLTIQILCAIHVTNVLFGSKKTMDVEYLMYLAEIYTKINS